MKVYRKVKNFYKKYKGKKGVVAKSVQGREIYYFKVEKTEHPRIIVQGAIHGREYVTALLILKLIKRFDKKGEEGTVYFIPVTNPDGVEISQSIKPLYKANANGVDLNVNFDARWGTGASNKRYCGDSDYIGERPFSEPESIGLKEFTLSVSPNMTVSYHSKGEEIYYEFYQDEKSLARDKVLAEMVAKVTNYAIKRTPNSAGGYKDWCIERLKIPALTIEVGNDNLIHPIRKRHLTSIYKKNKRVVFTLIQGLKEVNERKVYETGVNASQKSTRN